MVKLPKILITGVCGFVGSHLADFFIEKGFSVVGIDRHSGKVNPRVRFYNADVSSADFERIFSEERPDYVLHYAAMTDVVMCDMNYRAAREMNIEATKILAGLCKRFSVKKMIYASTAAVYGNSQFGPSKETDKAKPPTIYARSKLEAEEAVRESGIDHIIFRISNVYGEKDLAGRGAVIPAFMSSAIAGKPIIIYGDGSQIRDFISVTDVAKANLAAIEKDVKEGVYNLGSGQGISINSLIEMLQELLKLKFLVIRKPDRKSDIKNSCLNVEFIRHTVGFSPDISLKEGLSEMISSLKHA